MGERQPKVCRLFERGYAAQLVGIFPALALGARRSGLVGGSKGEAMISPFALSLHPFSGGRERMCPRGMSGLEK